MSVVVLLVAGLVAACGPNYLQFRLEVGRIKKDAQKLFPVGESALEFEKWFHDLGADGPIINNSRTKKSCILKTMQIRKINYCVDVLSANYCVNSDGFLEEITFDTYGYC